jgi:hypothetical protein
LAVSTIEEEGKMDHDLETGGVPTVEAAISRRDGRDWLHGRCPHCRTEEGYDIGTAVSGNRYSRISGCGRLFALRWSGYVTSMHSMQTAGGLTKAERDVCRALRVDAKAYFAHRQQPAPELEATTEEIAHAAEVRRIARNSMRVGIGLAVVCCPIFPEDQ